MMRTNRTTAMANVRKQWRHRSTAMLLSLEGGISRLMVGWLLVALCACALRIAYSPWRGAGPSLTTILPYILVIGAPLASMALALRWFATANSTAQPTFRLARIGRWNNVSQATARRHRLYGTSGLMVPLLVGMLLNVPLRTAEYLAAMPALSGSVPEWLRTLNLLMTFDVVLLSSLYVVAFVAGLRRLPSFPRLLASVWVIDLVVQAAIAAAATTEPGLPISVSAALHGLLRANVLKALVSITIWLPYLLLSKRVNVTFRHRLPA
ncbi:MAG: DUF2569 domain-containing protein [Sphingomicrobium sp.]